MTEDEVDQLPLFERLEVVGRACVATLRGLEPQKGARAFARKEFIAHPGEQWTAHKVMRRFLEREMCSVRGHLARVPFTRMAKRVGVGGSLGVREDFFMRRLHKSRCRVSTVMGGLGFVVPPLFRFRCQTHSIS